MISRSPCRGSLRPTFLSGENVSAAFARGCLFQKFYSGDFIICLMPKTRAQKEQMIHELTEAFRGSKSAAFSDYQGMTVAKITALRKQLSGAEVEYLVAKKTLLGLAAKAAGYDADFSQFPGMLGVAFGKGDEMAPAKIIGDAGKDAPIKLVGGIFEGKVVDQAYVMALSKLPSRAQLLGQLLNVFQGPTAAFVRVLNARREQQEGAGGVV